MKEVVFHTAGIGDWDSSDWSLVVLIASIILVAGGYIVSFRHLKSEVAKIPEIDKRVVGCEKESASMINTLNIIAQRIDSIWNDRFSSTRSPRVLNDYGKKILRESGFTEIITRDETAILEGVKAVKPTNAFRAEKSLIDVIFNTYKDKPEYQNLLEEGAYKSGTDVDTVLMCAVFYIRDSILDKLGMKVEDIDKGDGN